jgi:hypothetical protein
MVRVRHRLVPHSLSAAGSSICAANNLNCGRKNTVNGGHLEYFLPVSAGIGENRCGSRGPLEFSVSRGSHKR